MEAVLIFDDDRVASPDKGEASTWRGPTISTLREVRRFAVVENISLHP
jgi:hypothetical protein